MSGLRHHQTWHHAVPNHSPTPTPSQPVSDVLTSDCHDIAYMDAAKFGAHVANLSLKESSSAFECPEHREWFQVPLDGEVSIEKIKELTDGVFGWHSGATCQV